MLSHHSDQFGPRLSVRNGWFLSSLFLGLYFVVFESHSEEGRSENIAKWHSGPHWPSLIAAARTNHIPLEGIDPPVQTNKLQIGDSVTAVVTLRETGNKRTQWLLLLQAAQPNAQELAAQTNRPMTLYSGTGRKLEYASFPAVVTLRTLGPFSGPKTRKPKKVLDTSVRFAVDQGFLALGLDSASEAIWRFKQSSVHGTFDFGQRKPSDAEIARANKLSEALHITPEEEYALAGAVPALLSYFNIVEQTAGIRDIAFQIIDLPSAWSLVRNVGIKNVNFAFEPKGLHPIESSAWQLPVHSRAFYFPMTLRLNKQPALNLTLAVAAPQPPLLPCAGIVGLLAEKPNDPEKYLTLRVVSAGHGFLREGSKVSGN